MASTSKKEGNKEKFSWSFDEMIVLCDVCLQFIAKNGRGQYFLWKEIQAQVEKKIGRSCSTNNCKHKYDAMRRDWRLWKNLKTSETGLGWNIKDGKIDASQEWWQNKIKENKEYAKFQKAGVEQSTEDKWDQLFSDTYATGENVYVPTMEPPPVSLGNDENINNVGDEEETRDQIDLEDDTYFQRALLDDETFLDDFVTGLNNSTPHTLATSTQIRTQGDKNILEASKKTSKAPKTSAVQMKRKRRQSAGSAMLSSQIGEMVQMCKNVCGECPIGGNTQSSNTRVQVAMQIIKHMVENDVLENKGELWCYAMRVIENEVRREIFINFDDDESRKRWLEYMYDSSTD